MNHYFDTTHVSKPEKAIRERRAMTQDDRVLEYFRYTSCGHTQSQVHAEVLTDAPLTSVRRAMSNLTKAGKLIKTDKKMLGPFNHVEYVWELADKKAIKQRDLF